MYSRSIRLCRTRMCAMPLSSARSERGFSGRWMSAIIAVLVTRGSATIRVLCGFASRYWQRMGWLSAMLAPMSRMTSARLQVFVSARRPVAAERELVAGDRRRHAERGVAVVVVGAESELHQLAQRVEFFRHQLPGADHAQRARPVPLLRGAETLHHGGRSPRPSRPRSASRPLRSRGCRSAVLRADGVVLGEPFRAQLAAIHGMRFQRTHRHRAIVRAPRSPCRIPPSSSRRWWAPTSPRCGGRMCSRSRGRVRRRIRPPGCPAR